MSGHSDQNPCPICDEQVDTYTDYKPFDRVSGECINCGFCYYTKVEQMPLAEVNELRKEHNENYEPEEQLKPLKQADLDKYKEDIKNL